MAMVDVVLVRVTHENIAHLTGERIVILCIACGIDGDVIKRIADATGPKCGPGRGRGIGLGGAAQCGGGLALHRVGIRSAVGRHLVIGRLELRREQAGRMDGHAVERNAKGIGGRGGDTVTGGAAGLDHAADGIAIELGGQEDVGCGARGRIVGRRAIGGGREPHARRIGFLVLGGIGIDIDHGSQIAEKRGGIGGGHHLGHIEGLAGIHGRLDLGERGRGRCGGDSHTESRRRERHRRKIARGRGAVKDVHG